MIDTPTAWQMYDKALQERKSTDPTDRRQACEKGWLAVTIAVDEYLAMNNRFVPKGRDTSHVLRNKYLAQLAESDDNAEVLVELVNEVSHVLHGACFYAGKESLRTDFVLEHVVREILERTEHAP